MLLTSRFVRNPFYVDAVQVTEENIADVSEWVKGPINTSNEGKKFVKVKVKRFFNPRQTQAFVGDWVLFAGDGFKVYTEEAFKKTFSPARAEVSEPVS